jgi:hypothetical protein
MSAVLGSDKTMPNLPNWFCQAIPNTHSVLMLAAQVLHRIRLCVRSWTALAAEHLFAQHQLALYQARHALSRCAMNATRLILVGLSYWFDWRPSLTIVQPETFKRWRRQGWRLLWCKQSKPGRPPIPPELQAPIRRMARENMIWGPKRIANELLLKLGLRVSPRTVRKYMPSDCVGGPGQRCPSQRWSTFIRNHAKGLIIRGFTEETARKAKVRLAHIRGLIQSRFDRTPQCVLSPIIPYDNVVVVRLDAAYGMRRVERLEWVDNMRRVERSPLRDAAVTNPNPYSSCSRPSCGKGQSALCQADALPSGLRVP